MVRSRSGVLLGLVMRLLIELDVALVVGCGELIVLMKYVRRLIVVTSAMIFMVCRVDRIIDCFFWVI